MRLVLHRFIFLPPAQAEAQQAKNAFLKPGQGYEQADALGDFAVLSQLRGGQTTAVNYVIQNLESIVATLVEIMPKVFFLLVQ